MKPPPVARAPQPRPAPTSAPASQPIRDAAIAHVPEPRTAPPPKPVPPPAIVRPPEPQPAPAARPSPAAATLPPPVLGAATAAAKPVVSKRRAGMGFVIVWAAGIGVGAVAAGAFIGFLVNGPPGTRTPSRGIADVAPPTSPATGSAAETTAAAATPAQAPAAPSATTPAAARPEAPPPQPADTAAARDVLPPLRPPAAPAAQAPSPSLATGDIREAQGRLRALGFNPGPVDGAAGPQTTAAVKQYQQARGLSLTGTLDKELLARLQQEPNPQHQAQAPSPPPRRSSAAAPPPPPRPPRDPLLDSIERLFRR